MSIKLYNSFIEFLLSQYAQGKRAVLIVDEAQNFKADMLEELRMLSNVNNEKDQLLQIVLVGQPELLQTLQRTDLRQFAQRIAVHCNIEPLGPQETRDYIRHRMDVAGGRGAVFSDVGCAAIHFFTGGIPRLINLLCDVALVYAFGEEVRDIGLSTVLDVVSDREKSGLSPFQPIPTEMNLIKWMDTLSPLIGG